MTKFDKLYTQIVNNPKDVSFEDLDKILIRYGFNRRQSRKGTSHYTYTHPALTEIVTVPFARPLKAVFVKEAINVIRKLERTEKNERL
ncbi:MAG: type II toxin-antitoxin system HicA family toxin [Desulfitobacterium hafniense]|nr:type II toxin-antitoxin system HicA family toxin [Desulfitobacterium hafniense]